MPATRAPRKITLLIVDDSVFMRHLLTRELGGDPEIEVVGAARDGVEALELVEKLNPDVVTLDVEMPRMDGLTTLTQIMARYPRPVVMLSSLTQEASATTIRALEAGAADFVGKPSGPTSTGFDCVRAELLAKLKNAARGVNVSALTARVAAGTPPAARRAQPHGERADWPAVVKTGGAIVIGSSTGGPRALATVVPALPADLPLPVLIVQHMPAGFTRTLAERLNSTAGVVVREAKEGDLLQPGLALLAPGGLHMEVDPGRRVRLNENPPVHGVRPAVDVTIASAANVFGKRLIVAILTGMGNDGASGAKAVHDLGGRVIAEHESTCIVYGMPRSVVEIGAAHAVVALPRVASEIENQLSLLAN